MSRKTLLARAGSLTSTAFANKDASTSIWTGLEAKYGRKYESIIEMNIQKASSSGAWASN
jgi:hypothetical protein